MQIQSSMLSCACISCPMLRGQTNVCSVLQPYINLPQTLQVDASSRRYKNHVSSKAHSVHYLHSIHA
jgi:hypothetical protein